MMTMEARGYEAYMKLKEHAFVLGWKVEDDRQRIENGEDYESNLKIDRAKLHEVYTLAAVLDCYMDVHNVSIVGRNARREGHKDEYEVIRSHVREDNRKRLKLNREWGIKDWEDMPVKKPAKHCTVVSVPL